MERGIKGVRLIYKESTILKLIPESSKMASASAGVAEQADAADLKSAGAILVGSSPTPGI
jgi:hypothetical protein